ncbi:Glu/Leu/Phe/Val dehydrogenase dimerization domain-containing protein [Pseudonocardia sp. TRM90224]|uniref:Glu/Leu/Phe/Val dehydrogenase dimerization domain-containing protein n=1 Tax=Pseudonocardia sp. TRM90224 TaxID=2812678 RepID=UPI001E46A5B4|nr:Glu/Leu/Phe/Val dehydrogenase dimerization domain-containing protein [Pseudonocardia sp. TRM90224]
MSESEFDSEFEHESLVVEHDPATGSTAVVAVHSTTLGPAIGGLRIQPYPSLSAAVTDALRLSKAMTLKTAAAGLPLGGGKAVMLPPPTSSDRRARMHALGRMVERLEGGFVVGEDVGTTPQDMDWIAERTNCVTGRSPAQGGLGDPSPATAETVFGAVRSAYELVSGSPDLTGCTVGVLGVGKVGAALAALVAEAGAQVVVADTDADRAHDVAAATGARVVPVDGFATRPLDVFAPCAGGQVLSRTTVDGLRCRAVVGAANNQLTDDSVAELLHSRGILYVPDFIANCGGVIFNGADHLGLDPQTIGTDLKAAVERTTELLRTAIADDVPPLTVALDSALERIRTSR